jgi:hypothetical protein
VAALIAIVPTGMPSVSALPEAASWRAPVREPVFASPAAPTATLTADYRFRGNLAASVGSMPMTSISVTTFVSDTLAGLDCTVLRFEAGSGLQITSTTPVSSADFSVALLFRFDTVNGYRRILDLRNNTSDNGLYVFNGALRHYPGADTNSTVSQAANEYAQVVFTRRGADNVTRGYVDGVERIVFTDTGNLATILSTTLRLFKDAAVPALNEESGGYIARARLWNGSLTPAEVAGLNRIEPGQCDPELSAVPNNAAMGGIVHVRAYGLPVAVNGYFLGLNPGVPNADTELLPGVFADANGYLSATVTLPPGAPTGAGWIGLQTINALLARPDAPAAGSGCPPAISYYDLCVPFTVNPTPTLALSPASARVGQTVRFTATNLVAGQARLSLAGAGVFAAGRVAAGTLTGTFILAAVPGLAYGTPVTVTLQNLRVGTLAGGATALLTPLTATPTPSYTVRNFAADFTPNSSGLITLTGIISPAPALEFLGGAQFNPMWHNAGVPPFPLTPVSKNLNPDGSFVVTVYGPSLYSGDAGTPQDNPAIGMNVVIDTLATTISSTFPLTANLKLTIQTFSGTLSAPTPAYVSLESRGERQVSIKTCQDGQAAKQIGKRELIQNRVDPLINPSQNQLDFYAKGTRLAGNPADKVSNGATPKAHTTPGGELQLDLPAEIIDMDVSPSHGVQLFGSAVQGGLGLSRPSNTAGQQPAAPGKSESCVNSSGGNGIYEYRLQVSKPFLGIQPSDNMSPAPGGQPGFIHHYFAYTGLDAIVQFNTKLATNKLSIDTHPPSPFVPMSSPYKVVLTLTEVYTIDNAHDALWSGFTIYQPQATPSVLSVNGKESKNGAWTLTAKLGPGLKEIQGQGLDGVIPPSPLDLYFDMENNKDGGGKVANASVRVLNPDKQVVWQSPAFTAAIGSGVRVSATMPDWRRTLVSGTHQVEFVLQHPGYTDTIPHTVTNLSLYAEALPKWFLQQYTSNRSIVVNAAEQIELYGEKAAPARIDRTPSGAVNALGQPANNSGVDTVKMTAYLDALGTFRNKPQNDSSSNSIGANGGGAGLPALPGLAGPKVPEAPADTLDDLVAVSAGGSIKLQAFTCTKQAIVPCVDVNVGGSAPPYPVKAERVNVIDTGWLPLYRDSWGIWPIASAQVGVDYSVVANLTAQADLDISKNGIDYSRVYIEPDASAGVDVWLNLSVIAGLVEAEIHAVPQIGMDIGVTVTNIQRDDRSLSAVAGFWYQVDAKYHACLAWCLKENEGVQNIIPYGCITADGGVAGAVVYPCRAPIPVSRPEVVTLPPRTAPFLTVGPSGRTMQVWQRESDGYLVSATDSGGGFGSASVILASTVGSRPQAAFVGPSRAIAVWRHATNVSPGASFTQAVASQSIRFATWNGNTGAWSAHQLLSAPAGGAGAPVIAGYFNPVTGASEAIAAWTVDMVSGGDLAARNTRVYWSRYRDGAWIPAQLADDAGSPGESQPYLTYGSDGVATLAWLKGTSNLGAPQNRRIAFRRLDGSSSAVSPAAMPGGVYEFSLAATGSVLNFAYTLIQASDQASQTAYTASGLIGDRKYLYAGTWNGSAWVQRRLRDQYGRSIKAETPAIAMTQGTDANISFRQIGIGATPGGAFLRNAADPKGIALGSGELAQLNFAFTAKSFGAAIDKLNAKVSYLTTDGALNWKPSAVYNSVLNKTVVASVSGPAPGGFAARKEGPTAAQVAQRPFLDEPIALAETEALPDLELASVGVSTPYPTLTTTLILTAVVRNNGADLSSGFGIDAAWGLPPGAGQVAGTKAITGLTTGESVTVSLVLTKPANVNVTNTLFVQVNMGGAVLESDTTNNAQTLVVGGLPPPSKVTAAATDNNPFIFVDWVQTRADPRIVGWRVYRSLDGQAWAPAGSSFVDGWVDVTAEYGKGYLYRVASYDAFGNESPLSASMAAAGPAYTIRSVFIPRIGR